MAFNSKSYKTVRERFDRKRSEAEARADAELIALHRSCPELEEVDRLLSEASKRLLSDIFEGKGPEKGLEEIGRLTERRRAVLDDIGVPADCGSPEYECSLCRDTGYVGGKMCECLRRALVEETIRTSGIGELVKTQSFDSFSTDYFKNDPAAFELAGDALFRCKQFAEDFEASSGKNLLLIGATGLGKTHLSTSVAKRVIERGFDVVYDTAQNIFRDFEQRQFGRWDRDGEDETDRYFDCDLLIIDDLGTEMTNSFTVSCLYNIVNTRLNRRASMIINTNLPQKELLRRYEDRITSRMFGEFDPLFLIGKDIRSQKRT